MTRRVVITGLGIVSPVGNSTEQFFSNLMSGISGIKRLQSSFVEQLAVKIGAPVSDFNPSRHFSKIQLTGIERFSQMALVAAEQAVHDAKLVLNENEQARAGIYMGSCLGGAGTLEDGYVEIFKSEKPRIKPLSVLLSMNNAAASHISIKYHLQGPNITYSTACSSSAIAIGEAYRQIKHGYADVMLAGGAEAMLTLGAMKAWEALRTLATEDANDAMATNRKTWKRPMARPSMALPRLRLRVIPIRPNTIDPRKPTVYKMAISSASHCAVTIKAQSRLTTESSPQ